MAKGKPVGPVGSSAAQQMVDAALAPLLANLNQQGATLGRDQAGQQAALRGYTKDIIGYLKGTPKAIASDYNGAIAQQAGIAGQYAAQQRMANPNAAIQSSLRAVSAPPEQIAQLAAQNQKAYGGSAANLFALGGAIPNTAFAADKAAAAAFARTLPAIQGLQGQRLFQSLLASQSKDSQALSGQRAELESERIKMIQDAQEKALEASAPDPNYYKDSKGRTVPKGYRFNAKGELQSIGTAGSKDGASSPSPATKGRFNGAYGVLRGLTPNAAAKVKLDWRETALNTAHDAFNGTDETDPLSYQEALQLMMDKAGIPLDIAQNALNRYWRKAGQTMDWEKPGEGRPKVSYQQRRRKK